jgi:putative phosphoribosyl transferase
MKPTHSLDAKIKDHEISMECGEVWLQGSLAVPQSAKGIVLFVHGSGSSRYSPRNRFVARTLQTEGMATLLFDLLTLKEERIDQVTAEHRFDIRLLADRLIGATQWVMLQPELMELNIGYFGASTGAAAALIAAAEHPYSISAVVSRGGRPDLAGEFLRNVQAPTLLLVGGNDQPVINMNREALVKIGSAVKKLVIVPGATHLFEEPGTLEKVAGDAAEWFANHLATGQRRPRVSIAS